MISQIISRSASSRLQNQIWQKFCRIRTSARTFAQPHNERNATTHVSAAPGQLPATPRAHKNEDWTARVHRYDTENERRCDPHRPGTRPGRHRDPPTHSHRIQRPLTAARAPRGRSRRGAMGCSVVTTRARRSPSTHHAPRSSLCSEIKIGSPAVHHSVRKPAARRSTNPHRFQPSCRTSWGASAAFTRQRDGKPTVIAASMRLHELRRLTGCKTSHRGPPGERRVDF